MKLIVYRECLVLSAGFLAMVAVSVFFANAGRGPGNPVLAMLLPIALCLGRASFVSSPPADISRPRRLCHSFVIAAALLVLLLFESAIGFLMGARDVPIEVWAIVAATGFVYVLLFCIAYSLATVPTSPYTPFDAD